MSWQEYVDESMVETGKISKGAIIGLDGSVWAISPELNITEEEINNFISSFSDPSSIREHGLYISTEKYLAIRCDDRSVYGKNKGSGCICVKTESAILIGIYEEGMVAGDASKTIEELADYLIEQGY